VWRALLWLRFYENHNPPKSFLSIKAGYVMGFSYGKSVVVELE
jgi:hypothetical protein